MSYIMYFVNLKKILFLVLIFIFSTGYISKRRLQISKGNDCTFCTSEIKMFLGFLNQNTIFPRAIKNKLSCFKENIFESNEVKWYTSFRFISWLKLTRMVLSLWHLEQLLLCFSNKVSTILLSMHVPYLSMYRIYTIVFASIDPWSLWEYG